MQYVNTKLQITKQINLVSPNMICLSQESGTLKKNMSQEPTQSGTNTKIIKTGHKEKFMLGLRQLNTKDSDPKISRKGSKRRSTKFTPTGFKLSKMLSRPSVAAKSDPVCNDIRSYFNGKVERGKVTNRGGGTEDSH